MQKEATILLQKVQKNGISKTGLRRHPKKSTLGNFNNLTLHLLKYMDNTMPYYVIGI